MVCRAVELLRTDFSANEPGCEPQTEPSVTRRDGVCEIRCDPTESAVGIRQETSGARTVSYPKQETRLPCMAPGQDFYHQSPADPIVYRLSRGANELRRVELASLQYERRHRSGLVTS